MMVPAGILGLSRRPSWESAKDSAIRHAIEKGFAPLTVGLVPRQRLYVMSRTADHDFRAYALTAICTGIFVFTKINPLIVVAIARVISWLGFV